MKLKIDFVLLLKNVLATLNFNEQEKKEIIRKLGWLTYFKLGSELVDNTSINIDEIEKLSDEQAQKYIVSKMTHLPEEDKTLLIAKSSLQAFLDILDSLVTKANKEETLKIGKTLIQNKPFYEVYKTYVKEPEGKYFA